MVNTMNTTLYAAGILLILGDSVSARDWRVVGSSNEKEVLVDVDSVKAIEGSHHEAIILTRYKINQKLEGIPPFRATVSTLLISCLRVSGSLSKLVFIASDGESVANFTYPVEWKPIDLETDVGIAWKYVCTKGWER